MYLNSNSCTLKTIWGVDWTLTWDVFKSAIPTGLVKPEIIEL